MPFFGRIDTYSLIPRTTVVFHTVEHLVPSAADKLAARYASFILLQFNMTSRWWLLLLQARFCNCYLLRDTIHVCSRSLEWLFEVLGAEAVKTAIQKHNYD